ncbi:glutamyl-tRNA reductase [Citricoccus sp. SGAir0253]|uniref:glutamyl-tRNA reductase n=1 Tax=Citricoccus sp. SGAir0253 TaxID=2567881 RepID=UPI0010CCB5C2|nr:glutamyl-tRNA reductase [Citricoccus sp. SGAir0253]QCU77711.1 glutamyl-tRNA reductase [Citricoccus sp. SGAir0253]
MALFSLVASHTDLDLDTVAQLSNGTGEVASVIPASTARGAVVLATCNRVEIYAEAPDESSVEQAREELLQAVSRGSGLAESTVASSFRTLAGDAAVRHLFEVGAGLKSAVVGEREIAGQVRRALGAAQESGITTGTLTKLFETATRTAKDVGTHTALGAAGRSIVSVALDLATSMRAGSSVVGAQRFWEDANVLLIGTGAYAGTTLAQLADRGALNVGVHSASGRAEAFVADRGGWALALGGERIHGAIAEADVIIGCSGGDRRLEAETLQRLREGVTRRLTVLDLALSHDFDPAIADLPGVDLITLESVKMAAPEGQRAAMAAAARLVDSAVDEYLHERRARSANEAIVALRRHTHQVLDSEMERVRARHGCTAAAEEVEFALRRMVRQILHEPTVRAKELAAEGRLEEYERALNVLFGLEVPGSGTGTPPASCPAGVGLADPAGAAGATVPGPDAGTPGAAHASGSARIA